MLTLTIPAGIVLSMKTKKRTQSQYLQGNKKLVDCITESFNSENDRVIFCKSIGTTWGYLKKTRYSGQPLNESVCINVERELNQNVVCEDLRPDVDWAFIRGTQSEQGARP